MGPIHQFEMIDLFPIAKIGNVKIAFTNSAPVRFQALAEMTYKKSMGASISINGDTDFWFGEDQARYVIAAPFAEAEKIVAQAQAAGITVAELGKTGGDRLTLEDKDSVTIAALKDGFESWFPNYMAGEEIPVTN